MPIRGQLCAPIDSQGSFAEAAQAPKVGIRSFSQLRTPLPSPYEATADANADIAAAKAKAIAEHKLLMIDLGANWCADCRILSGTLEIPEVHDFVNAHYVLVNVDVDRFNKNLQIPASYGVKRLQGVPSLLVVDPSTETLLDKGRIAALAEAGSMSPQALANWLAKWTRE